MSRFKVSSNDRDAADPSSEKEILRFVQPGINHNGGKMAFGRDGYLYVAFGDGGANPDEAQDRTNLFGSIIRIDVSPNDDTQPYSIPSSNPFYNDQDSSVRKEIWAYGLRNPCRFSLDRSTGALWAGDVGQNDYEEVNIIRKGRNYGWPIKEGFECYIDSDCSSTGLESPVAVYTNTPGSYTGECAVTGGYVYRGPRLRDFVGKYIYGDYYSGKIWAFRHNGNRITDGPVLLLDSDLSITSFGEDQSRKLYILTPTGAIYTLK